MILDWLTIDGTEYHDVEVAVYELVPTEVFGQDAEAHDTDDAAVRHDCLGCGIVDTAQAID